MDAATIPAETPATVSQILARYEREALPLLAPTTQRDYRRHIPKLRAAFGERIADELRPRDFGEYLKPNCRGQHQRARQVAILSAAFGLAVSTWYMIERNVLRDVKRVKSEPRTRLVSDEDFASLRSTAGPRMQIAMDLALLTGQRQGDLVSLKWSQLKQRDDGIWELHFQQSKTGKRLAIEVHSDLEAVLDRAYLLPKGGKDGGEYVITRRCGSRYTPAGFRACWQRTINPWCRADRTRERFTFHDLRAMAACKCETIEQAMYLLGHSNISMTRRVYRRGIERVKSPVRFRPVWHDGLRESAGNGAGHANGVARAGDVHAGTH